MASRGEAREYVAKRKPYHKKWICCVVPVPLSLFQGSVSFRPTIVRFGMTNRSVKDCRVGRTRPPRNDKIGRFCGEMKRFSEQKVSNFSGAIPRKKQPQKNRRKMKNVRFPNKNVPILCHCEAAARPWQSLSQRYGIPWRSTGVRSKKEALLQKRGFAASFRFLFLYFRVLFRSAQPLFVSG